MKFSSFASLAVLGVALSLPASAEMLQGIAPLSTFGEIKRDFPNGRFERVKAAWVKEAQAFYEMTGDGFPGKLYLLLDDERPLWGAYLKDLPPDSADDAASESASKTLRQWVETQTRQPDDEALTINWVRWVPSAPIPMERVRAKYGEPSKCDFSSSDFSPFCSWEARSLTAETTADRKTALFFTASFTRNELRAAYKARGRLIPDWLKDPSDTKSEKASPKAAPESKPKVNQPLDQAPLIPSSCGQACGEGRDKGAGPEGGGLVVLEREAVKPRLEEP